MMGLHYPFGYVGYEGICLRHFINLMDDFCSRCHTNEDVEGDCKKCPVGGMIYKCKDYLINAYEDKNPRGSTILKNRKRVVREIKDRIKDLEPRPLFNSQFIFDTHYKKDELKELRYLLKEFEFYNNYFSKDMALKQEYREIFFEQWKKENENKQMFRK